MKTKIFVMAICLVLLVSTAAQAELLSSVGFEESNPAWDTYGFAEFWYSTYEYPFYDHAGMIIESSGGANGTEGCMIQGPFPEQLSAWGSDWDVHSGSLHARNSGIDVSNFGGEELTISAYGKSTVASTGSWGYAIQFDGGSWDRNRNVWNMTNEWTKMTSEAIVIPEGATTAYIWIMARTLGNDFVTGIDEIEVSATPEPATMALFGLGGLLLRRRKA